MEIDSVSTFKSLSKCYIYNHELSFSQKIGLFKPKREDVNLLEEKRPSANFNINQFFLNLLLRDPLGHLQE